MSIDIAIIDSGINPTHPHVMRVAGGCTFETGSEGAPAIKNGFDDQIGHGTAIAGIFREKLPDARLWALKIFRRDLTASFAVLHAAFAWAIDRKMGLIHLSLGTARTQDRAPLAHLCRVAEKQGILVSAAARSHDDTVCPAALPSVVGVYWNRSCVPGTIVYHPEAPIQFGAWGHPRPLPGLDQAHNFRGSSFAAAHVAARVARWLAAKNTTDPPALMRQLILSADTAPVPPLKKGDTIWKTPVSSVDKDQL